MAVANTITTGSALNKFWRKVQGNLAKAFAHGQSPEVQLYRGLTQFEAPDSRYEVTFPLDLNERAGIGAVPDGGYLVTPSNVNGVEATVSTVHYQGRISVSDYSRFTDRGRANQIARQLTQQVQQKVDAMNEHIADYLHGTASALLATTDTDLSGTTSTVTLAAGYGVAGITNAKFIASKFKIGDRIAATVSGGTLIDHGIVTAVDKSAGTIGVTWDASVSESSNGIKIYKANNGEGTTIAAGSDLNQGLVGFLDGFTAATLHGVAASANPNWAAAYSDTNAGRFTPAKLWKGVNEIENDGGVSPDTLMVSQGVLRDMMVQERAGLRYDSATSLNFDGDLKIAGMTIVSTKRVPPGYVYLFAKSAVNKWEILPQTRAMGESDLLASETYAGAYGRIDWLGNVVWKNRKALAYWTSQTEA